MLKKILKNFITDFKLEFAAWGRLGTKDIGNRRWLSLLPKVQNHKAGKARKTDTRSSKKKN